MSPLGSSTRVTLPFDMTASICAKCDLWPSGSDWGTDPALRGAYGKRQGSKRMTDEQSWGGRVIWLHDWDDDFREHLVVWPESEDVCPEVALCGRELQDCDYHHDPILGSVCAECVKHLLERLEESTPRGVLPEGRERDATG